MRVNVYAEEMTDKIEIISRDRLKPHLGGVEPVAAGPGHQHVGGRGRPLHLQWPLLLQRRGQGGLCSRAEIYV